MQHTLRLPGSIRAPWQDAVPEGKNREVSGQCRVLGVTEVAEMPSRPGSVLWRAWQQPQLKPGTQKWWAQANVRGEKTMQEEGSALEPWAAVES